MRSDVNSCFVAFVQPSSSQILSIYYTLYGLCKIKPLCNKKQLIFGLTTSPAVYTSMALSILFMYICEFTQATCLLVINIGGSVNIGLIFVTVTHSISKLSAKMPSNTLLLQSVSRI